MEAGTTTKYEEIRAIHEQAVRSQAPESLRAIPVVVGAWGIKVRTDDGTLLWTNLSVPSTTGDAIAIGFRYKKRDGTFTEGIFELGLQQPNKVERYYRGAYESARPEYAGTHKFQDAGMSSFTSVNTCSLYLGRLKVSDPMPPRGLRGSSSIAAASSQPGHAAPHFEPAALRATAELPRCWPS